MKRKRLKRIVMMEGDRITIRTQHGDIRLSVDDCYVEAHIPEDMNFLGYDRDNDSKPIKLAKKERIASYYKKN